MEAHASPKIFFGQMPKKYGKKDGEMGKNRGKLANSFFKCLGCFIAWEGRGRVKNYHEGQENEPHPPPLQISIPDYAPDH